MVKRYDSFRSLNVHPSVIQRIRLTSNYLDNLRYSQIVEMALDALGVPRLLDDEGPDEKDLLKTKNILNTDPKWVVDKGIADFFRKGNANDN